MDDIVLNGDMIDMPRGVNDTFTPEHAQQWVDDIIKRGYSGKTYFTDYTAPPPKRGSSLDMFTRLQTKRAGKR